MTTAQKVIKYLAVAFAIFLCVSIVGGIVFAVASVDRLFINETDMTETSGDDDGSSLGDGYEKIDIIDKNVSKLEIELSAMSLTIKTGNELNVVCNDEDVRVSTKEGKLKITEKDRVFNIGVNKREMILYLPEDLVFDKADIDVGAGVLYVEKLSAKKLDLDLGAGNAEIKVLCVYDETEIDSGAGKLVISDGELADLDFDMGVGRTEIKSRLKGKCELDIGVGACVLDLVGNVDDYKIKTSKGIGRITVDGRELSDGDTVGDGDTRITIDGGVGDTKVSFTES